AAGAVDVVGKPGSSYTVDHLSPILIEKIKAAAKVHVSALGQRATPARRSESASLTRTTDVLLALGASTGGVQALTEVLTALPADTPGTLIVQHMPTKFTKSFAERLDKLCALHVEEAQDGQGVVPGLALIAPGGKHMVLRRSGARYYVQITDGPEVHHQRPSVEVLFESVAKYAGANAVGAILTGMGADGAKGLLKMRQAGAHTLAQDEASCVVFGMPMEAIKCGGAEKTVPLSQVAQNLLQFAQMR
ncbi:MAG: chemotaxis protein CheB, partial [Phycisphaerae bacterium]